jgi:DNA topoisomerase-1
MTRKLVIVESPAKAKTIGRYLGKDYRITASVGHIRDLPEKKTGVNVKKSYAPQYVVKEGKEKVVAELRKEAEQAQEIYLATDPDREGEAIAWHISEILSIPNDKACRISFNEITETAVQAAVASPRRIDMDLVNAQQARRILDRLVGYELSPVLWKKVRKGLSAGRVQSVATRMVVDREKEITSFNKEEYWVLTAVLSKKGGKRTFKARYQGELSSVVDKKDKNASVPQKTRVEDMETAVRILEEIQGKPFSVLKIKKGTKKPSPQPPFTTSTLQQEASRRLSFPSKKTMSVAQQLYEGVDIAGHGTIALVTYIRTDSVRISEEAVTEARRLIETTYGPRYVPASPRRYANKNTSQDAHEAIRPAHFDLSPDAVRASLTNDQFRLYRLVWERFLASQMPNAEFDVVTVDVNAGRQVFRAVGETPRFDGFLAAFGEKEVEKEDDRDDDEEIGKEKIPELSEGEPLDLAELLKEQKFTQPPPRYTEATLIKALEEQGIGRPSTYAPTLTTILDRNYIEKDKKYLVPTDLGVKVTEYLIENFLDIVDVKFTARMESRLDTVAEGENGWVAVLDEFYPAFHLLVLKAQDAKGPEAEPVGRKCPTCGEGDLLFKEGRFGRFISCSKYPTCKHTEKIPKTLADGSIDPAEAEKTKGQPTGEKCPTCGEGDLLLRESRYGQFLSCSLYPTCKFTRNIDQSVKGNCPKCGSGLVVKVSKKFKGKRFFTCDRKGTNAECDFISWDLPMEGKTCEVCGSYMVWHSFKGRGGKPQCGNRDCSTIIKRAKKDE